MFGHETISLSNRNSTVAIIHWLILSFPHSILITVCAAIVTRWMPLVEQELPGATRPEHLSSHQALVFKLYLNDTGFLNLQFLETKEYRIDKSIIL
jgi:hypothetical protein